MASTNFYLKNPDANLEQSLIYLFFSYNNKRLKYSTGETVAPKDWNPKKQRVKNTATGSTEINIYLNKLQEEIQKIYRRYISDGETPSVTLLNKQLSEVFRNPANTKGLNFFEAYDQFVETTRSKVKYGTTQKYLALKAHLKAFQKKTKFTIDFETLDAKFYDKLLHYFTIEKGILNNTIGKYISTLKTFLHWSTERAYNKKQDFMKFKAAKIDADIVYLEYDELMRLYHLDLSKNEKLEKVRDTFCLGCFTGLRFSDIKQLKPENIRNEAIILNSFKTRETILIPLNSFARKIVEKYIDQPGFLQVISNQKMNDYIKELCQLAEIDQSLTLTKFRGAERVEITKPKFQFITTHTARRTFVTLSLEQGMRPEIVMQITGHKEYKTFKKYIKITDKVKEVEMLRIWDKKQGPSPLMKVS